MIEPGALGTNIPSRPLTLSPLHAVLLQTRYAQLLYGESEVFVAAKHLVDGHSIRVDTACDRVSYCHLLLDRHSVLFAEGGLVESLFPGDLTMNSVDREARAEIMALFPDLQDRSLPQSERARMQLKRYEAIVLLDYIRSARPAHDRKVSRVA